METVKLVGFSQVCIFTWSRILDVLGDDTHLVKNSTQSTWCDKYHSTWGFRVHKRKGCHLNWQYLTKSIIQTNSWFLMWALVMMYQDVLYIYKYMIMLMSLAVILWVQAIWVTCFFFAWSCPFYWFEICSYIRGSVYLKVARYSLSSSLLEIMKYAFTTNMIQCTPFHANWGNHGAIKL